MARPENILIERHITAEELLNRIKSLEKDVKVLQRLYFIKYRYEGATVEDAAKRVEISRDFLFYSGASQIIGKSHTNYLKFQSALPNS
ncbi:MAG: hypothetical protein MUP85_01980 [Candidatus Lokiarchaeota archaeon]|nr:hypothetical protein [Candidatus Lokiarchaeota archaeon]